MPAMTDPGRRLARVLPIVLLIVAVAAPVADHIVVMTGRGVGIAVTLGVLQAIAVGVIIAGIGGAGRHRRLALVASATMLAVLVLGLLRSPVFGLRLAAGSSHALLYASLLAVFTATLLPGRTPIITVVAQRLNKRFHAGMLPYTRHVTMAWCIFFAGQLVVSLLLFCFAPARWWSLFINGLNVPLVVLMFLGEYAVRRHRFPESTDIATMIRGYRQHRAVLARRGADAQSEAAVPPDHGD
jgi:uncharacterized membrane protein